MMSFVGGRIRSLRISFGISAKELAKLVGLHPFEINAMEAGLTRVPARQLVAIAEVLRVRLSVLFGGEDDAFATRAADSGAQPASEATRVARAYERIEDPARRKMLLTLSEMLADGSGTAAARLAN